MHSTMLRLLQWSPLLLLLSCSGPHGGFHAGPSSPARHQARPALAKLGYSVQVGAFADVANAVRLEGRLQDDGLDAFYFRHASGLYKVRFGDHPTYASARSEAEGLHRRGIIADFFIVEPQLYPAARVAGGEALRRELVATARRFLGVPYCWGGESVQTGFDCSGLTMVTYRLNGLKLPRNSRRQFGAGRPVARRDLRPGDLVFFATEGGRRVTHVGLYIGGNDFIHAPRRGKDVRVASLDSRYFRRAYVGGRSYL